MISMAPRRSAGWPGCIHLAEIAHFLQLGEEINSWLDVLLIATIGVRGSRTNIARQRFAWVKDGDLVLVLRLEQDLRTM